jgi:hypothetical protein
MDKFQKVNKLLTDWNPLSVIGPALSDEYLALVPAILSKESQQDLENFFKQIFAKKYGLEHEDFSLEEKKAFEKVIAELSEIILE